MRILFVCHRFPYPPVRGGKIRPFNMIRWLSREHEVTVASIARSDEELKNGRGISPFCHRYIGKRITPLRAWLQALACVFSTKPSSLGYFYVPELQAAIRETLQREPFDLIWVHCSSVSQYVSDWTRCHRVMDFGDMDSEKWFQYARKRGFPLSFVYLLEGAKLRRYEKQVALAFSQCTVTAPREQGTLESYNLGVPVTLIPNGVDLDFFRNQTTNYEPRKVVFLGRMDYYPNIDGVTFFCEQVLPRVRQQIPDVSFTIVGSGPVSQVKRLGSIRGVTVTGEVPDVRPFVHDAAVSVVPLRLASGVQNKVLESMAMSVPVVATSPASSGVDAVAGQHLLVDDSPDGFADKVVSVLRNPNLRQRLAMAGRERVEERHSWHACLQKLENVLAAVPALTPQVEAE
ncbi:MAG: TIGR03087 family PEP-CTERM/XrtA system glycosyltransferase [Acidobacteria bacterium]|nr:TIGR03087 family PEP-CTERM/XrtA system glycosyltransferase [Acidobacteriota bacterium]MCI0724267.1 TIGR03087 family PEP-CTERM/XrtA system glycosyltransferase [Acidobacteriota bacterium]